MSGNKKILEVIKSSGKAYTVESIYGDLKSLGINEDDTLLVHSSLSSIGWICGGQQAIIISLLKSVCKGTLVMPAFSAEMSDPADWENPPVPQEWFREIYDYTPAFELQKSPTWGVGKIPELFRTWPNTIRSNHPQVSFSANGIFAKQIADEHPLTPQYGMNSPLGKMYGLNAKVLMLGTGYDACTSFHLAEALNEKMPKKKMGAPIIENRVRVWKWFEDFYDDSDDFGLIGMEFEKCNKVNIGNIGKAESRLINMRTAVVFAKDWISNNRFKNS